MAIGIGEAEISGIRLAEQGDDPSTPASGYGQLYAKADGLYFIGDDGVVEGPMVPYTAPTAWTPTITQGVGVTLSANESYYIVVGKMIFLWAQVVLSSAGTGNNPVVISNLPVNVITTETYPVGVGRVFDTGVGIYFGQAFSVAGNTLRLYRDASAGSAIGQVPNFALASDDGIYITVQYPIA